MDNNKISIKNNSQKSIPTNNSKNKYLKKKNEKDVDKKKNKYNSHINLDALNYKNILLKC